MNKLGDAFPADLKESFVDKHVRPGAILYRRTTFPDVTKFKFVLVLALVPDVVICYINSKIPEFIQKRPKLLNAVVEIKSSQYIFLNHDSYAVCLDVNRELTRAALNADLAQSL